MEAIQSKIIWKLLLIATRNKKITFFEKGYWQFVEYDVIYNQRTDPERSYQINYIISLVQVLYDDLKK